MRRCRRSMRRGVKGDRRPARVGDPERLAMISHLKEICQMPLVVRTIPTALVPAHRVTRDATISNVHGCDDSQHGFLPRAYRYNSLARPSVGAPWGVDRGAVRAQTLGNAVPHNRPTHRHSSERVRREQLRDRLLAKLDEPIPLSLVCVYAIASRNRPRAASEIRSTVRRETLKCAAVSPTVKPSRNRISRISACLGSAVRILHRTPDCDSEI